MAFIVAALVIASGLLARDTNILCAGVTVLGFACAMPVVRSWDEFDTFDGTL